MTSDDPSSLHLRARVQEWVDLSLISNEAAQKILEHEEKKAFAGSLSQAASPLNTGVASTESTGSGLVFRLMIAGAIAIALGVISVIASNWSEIPDPLKLGVYFFLYLGLSLLLLARNPVARSPFVRESLLLIHGFWGLAGIGLIAQIFHTTGPIWQALLLWSLLSLGAAWLSLWDRLKESWVWLFALGTLFFMSELAVVEQLARSSPLLVAALPMLISLATALLIKRIWGSNGFSQGFAQISAAGYVLSLFMIELSIKSQPLLREHGMSQQLLTINGGLVLLLVLIVSLPLLIGTHWSQGQRRAHLLVAGTWLLSVIALAPVIGRIGEVSSFAGLVLTILLTSLLLATAALAALAHGLLKLVNGFILLIGLRVLVFWLEATGGLALSGFTLITFGLLLMGLAWLWVRKRGALLGWARQWTDR